MEFLGYLLSFIVDLFKIPFTIWGFEMSLWQILLFSLIVPIVLSLIVGFFND